MFVCRISLIELGCCQFHVHFYCIYICIESKKQKCCLLKVTFSETFLRSFPLFFYFFIIVCDRDYPCHLWDSEAFPHQEEYRTYQQHPRPATSTPRSRQIRWYPVYIESDMDDIVLRLKNFNSSVETKVKKIVNYVQKG